MASAERIASRISIVYFSVYIFVFLVASIFCAYEVEQQHKFIRTRSRQKSSSKQKVASNNNQQTETKEQIEIALTNTSKPSNEQTDDNTNEEERKYEPIVQSEDEVSDDDHHKDISCWKMFKKFTKYWAKSLWVKKKIYFSIVPHIFDQATDAGVIYTYYEIWSNPNRYKNENQS